MKPIITINCPLHGEQPAIKVGKKASGCNKCYGKKKICTCTCHELHKLGWKTKEIKKHICCQK